MRRDPTGNMHTQPAYGVVRDTRGLRRGKSLGQGYLLYHFILPKVQ